MVLRLIIGDDPILVGEAVSSAVDELVGDGDRSLMLELLTETDYRNDDGDWESAKVLDAARTPPFLTDRRVVVGRHLSRFSKKDDYSPIVDLLSEPLDTTDLVLVWERGVEPKVDRMPALPKALKEAAEVAGAEVVQTAAPKGKAAGDWLRDQLAASSLSFDRGAAAAVEDLLGEDRSRVIGLLRTLEGALGHGADVGADDIATFGGDQGSTVPWALDDAIDGGDVAAALAILPRLIPYAGSPTDRNGAAFRLLAVLHKRYSNMLRLDGADVRDDKAAATVLGMKGSTFPAKKAMQQSRRLGTEKLSRAIELLANADLALRGTKDWPPELVVEVLVARLANLSGRR
ncbi:MAG: DNA polymerase III subunit delta [Actinomycetota bacterium]